MPPLLKISRLLWSSRLIVLIAVFASLVTALLVFLITTLWVYRLTVEVFSTLLLSEPELYEKRILTHVIKIIDGYLLATVMLIFSLGLFELFIAPIRQAQASASRALDIHNLDDLKNRLGKVVVMIMIVKMFEHAIQMPLETPLDLLTFAGSLTLVGLALFLSHSGLMILREEPRER